LGWYDFDKNASLLEIGAGCGALTGLFCEKVKDVTAVELSKRRASIAVNRTKDKCNLEIIVGNFNDIKFTKQFDYITLIGVFEYAGKFMPTTTPHHDFLIKIKKLLKPNGTLIIAIENKFGLKYWAGAGEDHTGRIFDSIENYPKNKGVETFSKLELSQLLNEIGFKYADFYYPMPDYKIPTQIFTDEYLPQLNQMGDFAVRYDKKGAQFFDEKLAFCNLIKNKQFGFFSNSFLILAKNTETVERMIYVNTRRQTDRMFQIETSIVQRESSRYSQKRALTHEAMQHIENIYQNYLFLKEKYRTIPELDVVDAELKVDKIVFDYVEGTNLSIPVKNAVLKRDKQDFLKYLDMCKDLIYGVSAGQTKDFVTTPLIEKLFGKWKIKDIVCVEYANIDLIVDNIILKNDKYIAIDYEWVVRESIPRNYVLARTIFNLYAQYKGLLKTLVPQTELFRHVGIPAREVGIYLKMEYNFKKYVNKNNLYAINKRYEKTRSWSDKYKQLLKKILQR
jgi:SAM-dependent methyltransferase